MDAPFDLGLGAPPTPPQLPPPSSGDPSKSAKLIQLALMGLAGGLGPGAGTGILQGLHQTTQQRRQDALYRDRQNSARYEQDQQTYEMQARQFQQQQQLKQKAVADAFESLQKDAVNLPSRKALEERAGMYAQSLGYMGIRMSPQALIGQVRYLEPKERDVVASAVNANQKQFPKAWENGAPLEAHIRYTDPKTGEERDIQIGQAITSGLIDLPVDETGAWKGTKGVQPKIETRSLQVQAAEALAAGDTEKYNRLLKVDKEFADSGRAASNGPRDRYSVQTVTNADGTTAIMRVNLDTGAAEPVTLPPGVAGAGRPTEKNQAAADYLGRTYAADSDAKTFEGRLESFGAQMNVQLPNLLRSQDGQSYRNAQDEFINAGLRDESGAAIQPSEYDRYRAIYFAVPGDTPMTLKRKQQARERVIRGMRSKAGNLAAGVKTTPDAPVNAGTARERARELYKQRNAGAK
jgi:hypothetical protein